MLTSSYDGDNLEWIAKEMHISEYLYREENKEKYSGWSYKQRCDLELRPK